MQRHALKEARRTAGLTALAVAERCGIAEDRLYALERGRGRLHPDEVRRLATALNVPAERIAPDYSLSRKGATRE